MVELAFDRLMALQMPGIAMPMTMTMPNTTTSISTRVKPRRNSRWRSISGELELVMASPRCEVARNSTDLVADPRSDVLGRIRVADVALAGGAAHRPQVGEGHAVLGVPIRRPDGGR